MADPMYLKFNADSLADYIEKMPYLQNWDVVIPEGERSNKQPIALTNDLNIYLERRFTDTGRDGETLRINGDKSRVGSRPCTKFGLTFQRNR
jgi:hypothetical protein